MIWWILFAWGTHTKSGALSLQKIERASGAPSSKSAPEHFLYELQGGALQSLKKAQEGIFYEPKFKTKRWKWTYFVRASAKTVFDLRVPQSFNLFS